MLRIHLLGHPQVFDGDAPRPLPTPVKVLELCSYLLLSRRHPVSRDQLAFIIWPDVAEAEARANLRRHLHLLRKQLPEPAGHVPWILSERNTVQWNPQSSYWLDVELLEEFDESSASEEQWAAVVSCYRGELLEGFYDDWILAERSRLHWHYIHILEHRIAQQKVEGDLQGAIRTTQRLLVLDPLREELYRHLMELHYAAGDRAAALREFEKCRALLRDELGVEPMPETLALREAILQGEELALRSRLVSVESDWQKRPPAADVGPQPVEPAAPATPVRPTLPPWSLKRWLRLGGLLAALALVLALWASGALWSQPAARRERLVISGPALVQDTWINEEHPERVYDPLFPDEVFSAYTQVHLAYFNYPQDRVLIRFDLANVPPTATVDEAVLSIHLETFINEDLTGPLPATVSAFRLLVPWEPETATFNAPWSQPGLAYDLDYAGEPLGSQAIEGSAWVSIDVTDLVRDWLAQPDENWGLMLMITEAPQGAHYWVDTSDYPLANRRPRLDLTYLP